MDIEKLIKDYIKLIDDGLSQVYDPWELVVKLEDFLNEEQAVSLKKNNPLIAQLMIDDIYEITEQMEPDMSPDEFYLHLKDFKKKILTQQR